jgi:hypothetical protein
MDFSSQFIDFSESPSMVIVSLQIIENFSDFQNPNFNSGLSHCRGLSPSRIFQSNQTSAMLPASTAPSDILVDATALKSPMRLTVRFAQAVITRPLRISAELLL